MKFKRTVLSVSISAAIAILTACGGGGGGGSSYVRTSNPVPFYTPTRVGSVTPVNSSTTVSDSSALFSANISGTGRELIVAGRMDPNSGTHSTYNLSIFGWNNNTLTNKTSQWFNSTDNVIIGTEPSIKFADFNGDGRLDMYVAPNTDTNIYGPGVIYTNNGNTFTRFNIAIGNISGHDSAIADFNNDGITDIAQLSYGGNLKIILGSSSNNFTVYTNTSSCCGGAGIAVGDFLNNGTKSFIIADTLDNGVYVNKLVTYNLSNGNLLLSEHSILPTPRFLLPKWASYNFSGNHEVRALAFDFDNSGVTSAVIFSRPWLTNGQWPKYSEVQFLKNQGNGTFVDVSNNILVGYNHNTVVSYNPTLMDVNNDGLIDIVLSSPNFQSNDGSQVLIHTQEHKYVSSYATVLKAVQDQALDIERAINSSATYGANGVVFVQGPDGTMYLATAITYQSNGVKQKAIYLSKLGSNSVNAQATATAVRQTWPWMNDAQVNSVLAQSSTTWFGLNVLDPDRALRPIGSLSIPGISTNLNGSISGIKLNGAADQIKAIDSVGRDFNINFGMTSFNSANMFSRFADRINDATRSAQLFGDEIYRYNNMKFGGSEDNKSMVIGYTGVKVGGHTHVNFQYTRLPFSTFINLTGAWGLVRSSDTVETTINYKKDGWNGKLGLMYTTTEIYSGLVARINPITSIWSEAGYEWDHFKIYGGILPKVISGSATLTLPTGIDNQGRISYTNTQAEIASPTVQYARISYADKINRYTSFKLNAMVTSQKQQSILGEFRFNF